MKPRIKKENGVYVCQSEDGVVRSGETLLLSYCKWKQACADIVALKERDNMFNEWWQREYLNKHVIKFPVSVFNTHGTISPSVRIFWDEKEKKQTIIGRIVSWLKREEK